MINQLQRGFEKLEQQPPIKGDLVFSLNDIIEFLDLPVHHRSRFKIAEDIYRIFAALPCIFTSFEMKKISNREGYIILMRYDFTYVQQILLESPDIILWHKNTFQNYLKEVNGIFKYKKPSYAYSLFLYFLENDIYKTEFDTLKQNLQYFPKNEKSILKLTVVFESLKKNNVFVKTKNQKN